MVSSSLLCFGLGFLVLFHSCSAAQIEQVTDTTTSRQQRQYQQRFQTQCNIQNLQALEPQQRIESEAGVTEFWDQNNEQLQCANVAVFRHRIQQRGLLVPAYTNTAELFYVVQGRGIHGAVFPGCPETYQDQQQQRQQSYQSEGSRSQDQHQKVRQLREGDIVALPTGSAHWIYNNGPSQLVLVALVDVGNSDNQLDQYLRKFYLGGNPQQQLQGYSQSQGSRPYQGSQGEGGSRRSSGGNIFNGFDERLLADAFNVNPELIRRLQRPQMQRGIIVRVEEELEVLRPQRGQEQEQEQECGGRDNGLEETYCTMKLKHNINNPSDADVYNPRGGRITSVNSFNLPVLRSIQLSAEKGNLYQNAQLAPQWNLNSHSIVYVTRGSGRVQIVSENGNNVYDGQIKEGQLIIVPQGYAVLKRASNQGLEWISFKTNDNAETSQLAGRNSVIRGLPVEVIQNSFQVSRDDAQKLKYNRQELTVFAPGSRSESQ